MAAYKRSELKTIDYKVLRAIYVAAGVQYMRYESIELKKSSSNLLLAVWQCNYSTTTLVQHFSEKRYYTTRVVKNQYVKSKSKE